MVAASRALNDVDGSADNDEFDKIIAEHTRIVEIDRHTLFSQLAGASYTDEVIAEVKMQGTRDDASVGISTLLDGSMWKSKLRHVLGENVLRTRDDSIIHARIPDWKYATKGSAEEERLTHMLCSHPDGKEGSKKPSGTGESGQVQETDPEVDGPPERDKCTETSLRPL